jgi:beta-xylosidase
VNTVNGDEWFIHFQDRGLYGRICHLQPVSWRDDLPVVGDNGNPVYEWTKPNCNTEDNCYLQASDSFLNGKIGLCWQWMGDHDDSFAGAIRDENGNIQDGLRLFCINTSGDEQPIIWRSANVLTQKLIYPVFEAEVKLDATGLKNGNRAGVVMTGGQYVTAYIERRDDEYLISVAESSGADDTKTETLISSLNLEEQVIGELYFRLRFTYKDRSFDSQQLYFQDVNSPLFGENPSLSIELGIKDANGKFQYKDLGVNFTPLDHTWVGAKLGIYALCLGGVNKGAELSLSACSDQRNNECGHADFKYIEVREL